jgi:hypothetical protein
VTPFAAQRVPEKGLFRMLRLPAIVCLLAACATATFMPRCAPAQCCGATPTTAFSPVIAPAVVAAPATPVMMQTMMPVTTVSDRWYPGRWLGEFSRNLFGGGTRVQTNFAPAVVPTSTFVASTPVMQTAHFAPATTVVAGFGPTPIGQTSYRPTFPATWGPVQSVHMVGMAPLVQTVQRPVELTPITMAPAPAIDACGACSACGVTQTSFETPVSNGCSACSAAPQVTYQGPATSYVPSTSSVTPGNSTYNGSTTPQPMLAPDENPPADRSLLEKAVAPDSGTAPATDPAAEADSSGAYFTAPPLFDPRDKLTQRQAAPRHPAPTWTADYRGATDRVPAVHASTPAAPPAASGHQIGAGGWVSSDR